LSLGLLWFFPAALVAQEKPDLKIRTESDVVYGKGGSQDLKLNLAMPDEGNGPYPALILVHGGAWRTGSYKLFDQLIERLARRGFVAVSIQYRFCPEWKFPAQVEDCKCAVRWLRANAAKYKIDPNRIGAAGNSSGGHLVCMLGLTRKADGLEGKGDLTPEAARQSSQIQAVASFCGPTDFTRKDWGDVVDKLLLDFLGGTYEEKQGIYRQASPLSYVRKDPTNPPFIFFHGTKDALVNFNQSVRLHEALKTAAVPTQLMPIEGEGHVWGGQKLEKSLAEMEGFFQEHLQKK
jgi:acetyl esterase/lipase